jgi:large subunit ribosomal protein L13
MSTFVPSGKDISRKWYVIDATGQTLGRLATKAADLLSGKLNPQYVPYIDGGLREEEFTRLLNRKPEAILEQAIKGMLPKNKLGRAMGSKLKVYKGDQHPHQAQQPVAMEIK